MNMKKLLVAGSGIGLALGATASQAAIDVTAATTTISTDGTAAITAVGGAIIGLAAVAVVFKWVKGSIFG